MNPTQLAISEHFRKRLAKMELKEVRIKGLSIAAETHGDPNKIVDRCRKKGLLLTFADSALTMFPALTIDEKTAEEGLGILERCNEDREKR